MNLQFRLDGNIIEDPIGWDEVRLEWNYDDSLLLFSKTLDAPLDFHSDGYDYLKQVFDDNNFCESVDITIEHRCNTNLYETIFNGTIFISDVSFNLQKCIATVEVSDDSFHAWIKENKRMKFFLNGGSTKDGSTVSEVSVDVTFHNVITGIALPNTRTCYRFEDAFRYIIACATDNRVGFVSDFLSDDYDGAVLVTGEEIRTFAGTSAPEVSYQQLLDELNKKAHIATAVETDANGDPVIRLEQYDYFFQEIQQDTLRNVPDVVLSFDEQQLYSILNMGSDNDLVFDDVLPNTSFPKISWLGWREEDFNTVDKCNIDNELDLRSEFIIDSNNIENQLNGNDDEDDSTFIVMSTRTAAGNLLTDSDDFLSLGLEFYNERINNNNVSINWFGGVAASIARYLGTGNNTFSASRGSNTPVNLAGGSANFPNANYTAVITNPGGDYDGTDTYTAPADGAYVFQIVHVIRVTWNGGQASDRITVNTQFQVNGADVPPLNIQILQNPGPPYPRTITYTLTFDIGIYLTAADTVDVDIDFLLSFAGPDVPDVLWLASSTFSCINAINGGGIYQTYDADKARVWLYTFEYPITIDQFTSFTGVPDQYREYVDIEVGKGWINNLSFPLTGKRSTFTLISKSELNE